MTQKRIVTIALDMLKRSVDINDSATWEHYGLTDDSEDSHAVIKAICAIEDPSMNAYGPGRAEPYLDRP